jgi:hypothetical protein
MLLTHFCSKIGRLKAKVAGQMNAFFKTGIAVAVPPVVSIQTHQDRHSTTSCQAKLHEDTNFP